MPSTAASATAAPSKLGMRSRRPAPSACDTSVFAPRSTPTPKHTNAKPTTAASPTPASSSAPTCATNAVDASVIAEYETIEIAIGAASRTSVRPGRSDHVRSIDADMTSLEGPVLRSPKRRRAPGLETEEPAAEVFVPDQRVLRLRLLPPRAFPGTTEPAIQNH